MFSDIKTFLPLGTRRQLEEDVKCTRSVFKTLQAGISSTHLLDTGYCSRHPTRRCPRLSATVDFTGTPCTPWSQAPGGHHSGAEDPLSQIPLLWSRLVAADRVLVAIHENVPTFDGDLMLAYLKEDGASHRRVLYKSECRQNSDGDGVVPPGPLLDPPGVFFWAHPMALGTDTRV